MPPVRSVESPSDKVVTAAQRQTPATLTSAGGNGTWRTCPLVSPIANTLHCPDLTTRSIEQPCRGGGRRAYGHKNASPGAARPRGVRDGSGASRGHGVEPCGVRQPAQLLRTSWYRPSGLGSRRQPSQLPRPWNDAPCPARDWLIDFQMRDADGGAPDLRFCHSHMDLATWDQRFPDVPKTGCVAPGPAEAFPTGCGPTFARMPACTRVTKRTPSPRRLSGAGPTRYQDARWPRQASDRVSGGRGSARDPP